MAADVAVVLLGHEPGRLGGGVGGHDRRRRAARRPGTPRHCAAATGNVSTRRDVGRASRPGGAMQAELDAEMTTSRWMSRSCSKASVSSVTLTVPSMEFSMRDEAEVDLAGVDGRAARRRWWPAARARRVARSGWVSSACSVNVPSGPRKPTPGGRGRVVRRRRSRRRKIVTWTKPALRRLLDDVRCGRGRTPTTPSPSCAACPSPTSASPGSTTTGRCARGCPRRSTARARRPSRRRPSSRELLDAGASARCCSPGPTTSRSPPRSRPTPAAPGTAPPSCGGRAAPRPERVVVVDRRHRRPARSPTSARPCSTAHGLEPDPAHRRRASPACTALLADGRRARRRRRRGRRGRHGGRAGQRGRRPHRRPGRRRAHQRRLRRRARGRHRAAGHARLVRRRASPSSASTTASARPAPCPPARSASARRSASTSTHGRVTLAWFHCFSGIAGDMALGSLVDAGADLDEVRDLLRAAAGRRLGARGRARAARAASPPRKVHVHAEETHRRAHGRAHHRPRRGGPPARPGAGSGRWPPSPRWPRPRARLHRRPPEQVHFHEVGGLDAIVDVVGTCAALEVLGVDEVSASTGRHRHRAWSAPPTACSPTRPPPSSSCSPPSAPTTGLDVAVELTTPTGAALLAALASGFGPMPAMTIERHRLRRRHPRARRPAQRHPGRDRHAERRPSVPASPSCCSRPTSTTPPARCSPTPSPRCSRPAPTTRGSRRSS